MSDGMTEAVREILCDLVARAFDEAYGADDDDPTEYWGRGAAIAVRRLAEAGFLR